MRLEYDFAIVGLDKVERAMGRMESRYAKHNALATRSANLANRRAGPQNDTARAAEREAAAAERRIRQQRESAERYVFRIRQRHFQELQRQEDAAARKQIQNAERVARARSKSEARAAEREMRARETFRQKTVGSLGSSVRGTVGGLGRFAGSALAIGGGFAAADAVNNQLSLGRRYGQLSIQSRAPGETNPITKRDVQSRIESVSVEKGIQREELTSALEVAVAKTGDLKSGIENLDKFATLGLAFNASTADMAAAAAVLGDKFSISGDELADTLAKLGAQGRNAAFEFKDMASLVERLASAGQRFNFKGAKGVATLGGFTQIARTATGSSEQAATAVEATIRQLISKSGELQSGKALGKKVNVFEGGDPTKEARDFQTVLSDIISASGGDQVKLQKVFGDEGIRGVTPLVTAYSKASQAAGGGKEGDEAGRAAMSALFAKNIDAAGTYADAQKDAAEAMDDDSIRMTRAAEKISIALSQLTPIVVELAGEISAHEEEIRNVTKGIAAVGKFLLQNPIKGIGAIIAAKVVADLAAAAIGSKVSAVLVSLLRRSGGGGVPTAAGGPGGIMGGGGGMSKAGRALGATAVAASAGVAAYETTGGLLDIVDAFGGKSDARERTFGNAAKDIKDVSGMKNVDFFGTLADTFFTDEQNKAFFGRDKTSVKDILGEDSGVQFMTPEEDAALRKKQSERSRDGASQKAELKLDDAGLLKAAEQMKAAADKQLAAAEKLGGVGLNRSDSPTSPRK